MTRFQFLQAAAGCLAGFRLHAAEPVRLQQGLKGEYFNVPARLSALSAIQQTPPALVRIDPTLDFRWVRTGPAERFGMSHFAVKWTGYLRVDQPGVYTFQLTHAGPFRLVVAGAQVYLRSSGARQGARLDVPFPQAGWVPVEAAYLARSSQNMVRLEWAQPGQQELARVPATHWAHAQD